MTLARHDADAASIDTAHGTDIARGVDTGGSQPEEALDRLVRACATGGPVLLVDHRGHGGFVAVADRIDTSTMAALIRLGSGFVQVALPVAECRRLRLPPMNRHPDEASRTGDQCVAVDAADGVSTGISAADRARTARLLAAPDTGVDDLVRPGHVIPLRVDGAFDRGAAALELVRRAGGRAAVLNAVVSRADPRRDPEPAELYELAIRYGIPIGHAGDLLSVHPEG